MSKINSICYSKKHSMLFQWQRNIQSSKKHSSLKHSICYFNVKDKFHLLLQCQRNIPFVIPMSKKHSTCYFNVKETFHLLFRCQRNIPFVILHYCNVKETFHLLFQCYSFLIAMSKKHSICYCNLKETFDLLSHDPFHLSRKHSICYCKAYVA